MRYRADSFVSANPQPNVPSPPKRFPSLTFVRRLALKVNAAIALVRRPTNLTIDGHEEIWKLRSIAPHWNAVSMSLS